MKFSIVTPAYNMEKYISETIQSVVSQSGDFEIEYIIVNGDSTDTTKNIILDFKQKIEQKTLPIHCNSFTLTYLYQPNGGVYSAINAGFAIATGDIYAWIGADDVYKETTAFNDVATWFTEHPQSQWIKGLCGLIDQNGKILREGRDRTFYRDWISEGIYGREIYFIEQESVFWRADLWKKSGSIPSHLRSAGDYWLWLQFAQHASLDSIHTPIAYFRKRTGQISADGRKYREEQCAIMPHRSFLAYKIRLFSIVFNTLSFLSPLWKRLFRMVFNGREY